MPASIQFSVATHIVCFLAFVNNGRTTSDLLARSAGVNPAVIRRIMQKLTHAGLIVSTLGASANITLTRKPEDISLLDVYRAVTESRTEELLTIHPNANPGCLVGRQIPHVFPEVYSEIQNAFEQELSRVSVAQMVSRIANENKRLE